MTGTATICAPATLTDPLFKDLDLVSRRYLSHCWYQFSHVSPLSVPLSPSLQASRLPNLTHIHKFNKLDIEFDPANERLYFSCSLKVADRVCRDLAAHDGPDCNPFRELIPLAVSHPFLLHIIIATSAVHMSNVAHPKITALPPSLTDTEAYLQHLRTTEGVSRRAFLDSLVAKQKAIRDLRVVLQSPEKADSGVLLAAVLFFVNFELIDLGRGGWKTHLHGARRILNLLIPEDGPGRSASRTVLHDCIISDFVM